MNEVLAIGLQGMQADMNRLDQVATNIANVLTTGYKRGVVMQAPIGASFAAHMTPATDAVPGLAGGTTHTDLRAGTLKSTGQPLDLALAGNGLFEVMTEHGPAYTRQGNFQLDARGRLVTAGGHAVMGQSGEIVVTVANPTIGADGTIASPAAPAGSPPIARLKVVEIDPAVHAERTGDGLYAATLVRPVPPEDVQLRQGFIENSNVNSTLEMTGLIQAMRHFEGMQKVVQGYDEMLGVAIRKLGETS